MIRDYIILAVSSLAVGVIITFVLLGFAVREGIDLNQNLWLLAIPTAIALFLNILLLELYRKFRRKQ